MSNHMRYMFNPDYSFNRKQDGFIAERIIGSWIYAINTWYQVIEIPVISSGPKIRTLTMKADCEVPDELKAALLLVKE